MFSPLIAASGVYVPSTELTICGTFLETRSFVTRSKSFQFSQSLTALSSLSTRQVILRLTLPSPPPANLISTLGPLPSVESKSRVCFDVGNDVTLAHGQSILRPGRTVP